MNGKKARALRKICALEGTYKKENSYKEGKKSKRIAHTLDARGLPTMKEVINVMCINVSKVGYRNAKRAYKNGEFKIC